MGEGGRGGGAGWEEEGNSASASGPPSDIVIISWPPTVPLLLPDLLLLALLLSPAAADVPPPPPPPRCCALEAVAVVDPDAGSVDAPDACSSCGGGGAGKDVTIAACELAANDLPAYTGKGVGEPMSDGRLLCGFRSGCRCCTN